MKVKNVPDNKVKLGIKTEIEVPYERIAGEICTAMEQGCGYWARVTEESPIPKAAATAHYLGDHYFKYFHGGWTEFVELDNLGEPDKEGQRYRLNLDSIKSGIKVMAEKYPSAYGDFMAEDSDADTADVFLQCCLLCPHGTPEAKDWKLVYG